MNIKTFAVAVLALGLSAPGLAGPAKKIQCWKDENGNRMCGDRVPPEYAGKKREIMEEGRVVDTVRAAKTAEELAAEERAAEEAEAERKRAEYDRALLESYRNVADIQNMRDERIAMLDMRIRAAEKSSAETEKNLQSLRNRAAKETRAGPKKKLEEQIAEHEKSLADNRNAAERLSASREETRLKYENDAARYEALRPGTERNPEPVQKAEPEQAEPVEKAKPAKKAGS